MMTFSFHLTCLPTEFCFLVSDIYSSSKWLGRPPAASI